MGRPAIDLTGRVFGNLAVIGLAGKAKSGSMIWSCRCACGNPEIRQVWSSSLIRGLTVSCGCVRKERVRQASTKDGMSTHPLRNIWYRMWERCTDSSSPDYPDYGARGIRVCERWEVFANFVADMPSRPEGTSIDRIDNDKGYKPGNCRWATPKEQARNKRTNRQVTLNGVTKPLAQWVEELGLNYTTTVSRLNRGLPAEVALVKLLQPLEVSFEPVNVRIRTH